MSHLEPTYLRYIYDGLIKGSIHPENAAELPDGLIGMYDEAFDERTSVIERQKLLQFFAIWALLKKEVSSAFVSEVLGENEDDIQQFISTYSAWFNSPESGKYQLYHERLKVYLLQKLSEQEIYELHEKLIERLEQAIVEQKADEFEWYGLEFLGGHLAVSCYNKISKDLFKRFTDYALNDFYHNRQIVISSQFQWTFNLLHLAQYSTIVLKKSDVELINLKIIEVNERLQSSIHHIIQLIHECNHNIALVRINNLACHSENEVKTKLRLILLILTDIGILRKSKDLLDHNFICDLLEVFELESKKFKIDVFDLISPNIYFQIVLFLKKSNLNYKYLLNAIIFDWGFSGISKIMTTDFLEFFLHQNKQDYSKLEELFSEIREIAYNDNYNKNKSNGNYMHQGAIQAIDCMLISILLKLEPKKLEGFIKNSFKNFLDAFSYDYINSWINNVMSYIHVDSIVAFLYLELCSDESQLEDLGDKIYINRKLELLDSILLKAHLSKINSSQIKELFEYSENLLNEYLNINSSKSELEKKLEFFDLLILINIRKKKDINSFLNPIIELLNVECDDFLLNQIIRSLYFFEYTEHIPKLIKFYTDDKLYNRANVLVIEQSFNHEHIKKYESSYLENLVYKLDNDLSKNNLSKSSMFFVENLRLLFSNISTDKSDGFYEQYFWEQCLQLIVKYQLEKYVDLYINELLEYAPNLTYQVFYYLVKRPNLFKNRLLKQPDKVRMINLEIALIGKEEKKQIDLIYKLLLDKEKKEEIQWDFDSRQVYRYAKLKLEKGKIQDAINCISKVGVASQYFVDLIFDISIKLFQNNEEIDFAIDILQNVKYHFDSDEYDQFSALTVFHSFYHIENGKSYLSLVDGLLNKVLSYSQIGKKHIIVILKNVGVIDDNINLLIQNFYPFSFIQKIMDKDLRSIIGDLLNPSCLIEKPIKFSINRGIPNILNHELSNSEIETILNELNEYSTYFWEQDFFPDYNQFFNNIGLSKANILNPVHKLNITNLKDALIGPGISEYQPIYSFCEMLISNFKQRDIDSSLKKIFPEFDNKSILSEYLHKITLLNKLERNKSFDDFYHFNYLGENTNRDGLIKELFHKHQFNPKKHLSKLIDLDVFIRRKFLVYFFENISKFNSNEINWKLVYNLCGNDYVLINHFTVERIQTLLMQGKISRKLEKLFTVKKDYLSGINDLNNLILNIE